MASPTISRFTCPFAYKDTEVDYFVYTNSFAFALLVFGTFLELTTP
jgi:hypothetical protein